MAQKGEAGRAVPGQAGALEQLHELVERRAFGVVLGEALEELHRGLSELGDRAAAQAQAALDLDVEVVFEAARHEGQEGANVEHLGVEHAAAAVLALLPAVERNGTALGRDGGVEAGLGDEEGRLGDAQGFREGAVRELEVVGDVAHRDPVEALVLEGQLVGRALVHVEPIGAQGLESRPRLIEAADWDAVLLALAQQEPCSAAHVEHRLRRASRKQARKLVQQPGVVLLGVRLDPADRHGGILRSQARFQSPWQGAVLRIEDRLSPKCLETCLAP